MEAQLERLEGDRVRLTVEVPAARGSPRRRARDAATSPSGCGCPGFRPGKVPAAGARPADRPRPRLLGGGRVAHRQLVLERRADEPPAAERAQPAYDYELPGGRRRGLELHRRVRRTRTPSSRPTGRSSRCRGSSPRSPTRSSRASSQCSSARSPRSRRSKAASRATATSRSSTSSPTTGPGQRDYVVELGTERLLPELEDAIEHLLAGDTDVVGWSVATGRSRTSRSR